MTEAYEKRDARLAACVAQVVQGQDADKAYETLVRLCEAGVYEVAWQITRNREDAQDAAQDTFVKLWRLLTAGETDLTAVRSWYSYLLRMARNTALDCVRRRRVRPWESTTAEDGDGNRFECDLPDDSPENDPVRAYARKECRATVREAIDALEPEYREILLLREFNDCSYQEISEILSLEMGTVKSKLFRARARVKKYLEERNITEDTYVL